MNGFVWRLIVTAVAASSLLSCSHQAAVPRAPSSQEILQWLRDEHFAELDQRLSAMQSAYENRSISDQDLRAAFGPIYDHPDLTLAVKYDKWAHDFPKSYVAHFARGIYFRVVAASQRGVDSYDETPQERINAADGSNASAMAELDESIRLDTKPILSFSNRILALLDDGDPKEARAWLDRAIAVDPDNYVARGAYMAAIETRWGGSQEVMKAFMAECRKTHLSQASLGKLEALIYIDQGWIYEFRDENYPAAEAAYRKSAELGGKQLELENLVFVLFKQGKYSQAIQPLTEELAQKPGDPSVLYFRGRAYMQSGMTGEGLADTRAAAAAGDLDAQNALGTYYMTGLPGVLPVDLRTGLEWFRKSAAGGSELAQKNVKIATDTYPELLLPSAAQ